MPQDVLSPQTIELIDWSWVDTDVLTLTIPRASHSIYVMWEAGQANLRCWYVNLQEPLRRTPIGFDTMDQILDIVIKPDLSGWSWKDEDEFREAQKLGVFSVMQVRDLRVEGERVIESLRARAFPFNDGWAQWRPPLKWLKPELLQGWDKV